MRELADSERITRFMRVLGRSAEDDGACFLTGGATAVLFGWRGSTIDVDIRLAPENDAAMVERELVDADTALEYFERIAPDLYRFPAIDPRAFRRRVEDTFGTGQS